MNILKNFFSTFLILIITFLLPSQLEAFGAITGRITDQSGNPVEGVVVRLGLNYQFYNIGVSGPDGTYSIPNIIPNTYRITTDIVNFQRSGTTIAVVNNTSTEINFTLQAVSSTVSGNIFDSTTGTPIPNADVSFIYTNQNEAIDTTANSNGDYTEDTLQPGTYTISASATGYQTNFIGLNVDLATIYVDQDIALAPNPGTLNGTVSVSGGGVITSGFINYYQDGIAAKAVALSAIGEYSISGLAVGTYNVVASSDGYISKAGTAVITTGGTTTLDFALEDLPGAVSGTITDIDGAIIEGVRVDALYDNVSIGQAVTDTNGVYSIAGLEPGTYTLRIQKRNYLLVYKSVTITADTLSTVDAAISFNLRASINGFIGTVSDAATGVPIPGAVLTAQIGSQLIGLAPSDAFGRYGLFHLPAGSYTLTARAPGFQTAIAIGTIVPLQNTEQDFTLLDSPGTITGTISDTTPSGIDFATVNLVQDGNLIASAYTNPSGVYTISLVPPGTYSVQASKQGFETNIDESVTVAAGGTTTANLTLASVPDNVLGLITNAATGDIIPSAIVQLNPATGTLLQTTFSGVDGSFQFAGLAGGQYTISADAPKFFPKESSSFSVTTDTVSEEITVNLALTPLDFSPQTVVGSVVVNSFLLQDDRVHRLTWFASIVPTVQSYRIQRNGVTIANIPADRDYFIYDDHNRSPLKIDGYVITAINNNGDESPSSTIQLQ